MRLLAVTSPTLAQNRMTDDLARVGEITVPGTVFLVTLTAVLGAVGGLVYLLVRRILPEGLLPRLAGFGILTGTAGGALLVHDHPSFDYTILQPTWLAVALFILLPAGYGVLTAVLIEAMDRQDGLLRRAPTAAVIVAGVVVCLPTLLFTAVPIAVALVVSMNDRLRQLWASRPVTVLGYVIYAALVFWGAYGLIADVVSLIRDTPSNAPLTL